MIDNVSGTSVMRKSKVAVGVVTGPIHFMFFNGDYEEEMDTLGRIVYKYLLDVSGYPITEAAANCYVYLDDKWKYVPADDNQMRTALIGLRQKARQLALDSMQRRRKPTVDLKYIYPLQGE